MRGTPFLVLLSLLVACSCKTVPKPPLTTRYDPKTEVMVVYQDPEGRHESEPYAAAIPKRFTSKKSTSVDRKIQSRDTSYYSPTGEEISVIWSDPAREDILESFQGNVAYELGKGAAPLTKGTLRGSLQIDILTRLNPKIPFVKPTNVTATAVGSRSLLIVSYKGKLPAVEASKEVRRVFESVAY